MSVKFDRFSLEGLVSVYEVPGTVPGRLNDLTNLLLTTPG